jgi:hypothetical protein
VLAQTAPCEVCDFAQRNPGGDGRRRAKLRCREPRDIKNQMSAPARELRRADSCDHYALELDYNCSGGADVPFPEGSALLGIRRGAYTKTKSVLTCAPPRAEKQEPFQLAFVMSLVRRRNP